MRYCLMTILAVAFVLSGCDTPLASGPQEDASTNTNQNTNVSDPDPNPNPDENFDCWTVLKSTEEIAVWLEADEGWFDFGPSYTKEECPGGPTYELGFNPTSIFIVVADEQLEIESSCPIDLYLIEEDPALSFNFWEFEITLNSFWMLPGDWVFNFFPKDDSEAEGFELSASAFICGLGLDMLNLGCSGHIDERFFIFDGRVKNDVIEEGEWMPVLRFGHIDSM